MSKSRRELIAEARAKLAKGDPTDAELLASERAKKRDRQQKAELRKVVKALEDELAEMLERQAFIDELYEQPDPEPLVIPRGREKKGLPRATYVAGASDWHGGERVRPEHVMNRNEYDPDIFQERAEQYFHSVVLMRQVASKGWDIETWLQWMGGDLMTGYIHEEYLEENFLSPVEEALLLHKVWIRGIDYILAKSDVPKIKIVTNHGNHGRTGQKLKVSSAAKNSFEWMLYQFLAEHYKRQEEQGHVDKGRVEFQIANGYHNVVDVYGFRIHFHHGDAIGYAGGIGGTAIPANRRIGRRAQSIPQRWEGTPMGAAHLEVFGHFHQLCYPGRFIQNGSLIGWNDFADRIGAGYEDPQQFSFVLDERYQAVSNFNPILVTKPKKYVVG